MIFSFDYPPNDGGIARLGSAITAELNRRGIDLHVLTQACGSEKLPDNDGQIRTIRVTARRPWRELRALQRLMMQHDKFCLSGIWYPEGLLALLARCQPLVILAHGAELYPPDQKWRRTLWGSLRRYVLKRANLVVANSNFTAQLVESVAPGAAVVALPLAVDHNQFCPQPRAATRAKWHVMEHQRVICSVSRVHRFKGHETVLNALAKLTPEHRSSFVYLVAGKGPDIDYFQQRARELGVADQVRWLGFVSDDDLPSLYSASDVFVLMTMEIPEERAVEGFGLVFLEAQACGTPVIGARTGGIPDAISHGDGGWLLDQDDANGLAGLLLDLQRHPETFREMGLRARQRVEREFTWDHYMDRFIAALENAGIDLSDR